MRHLARIVAAVCESFVRVSPTNMIFSGLLKALLAGPAGASGRPLPAWTPPAPLPPLPEMVADDDAAPPVRAILQALRSGEGTEAFVPGLYRMLAHWPGLLAHLATVLSPRFSDPDTLAAGDTLRERIDAAVPGVLAHLPGPAHGGPPVPRRAEHAEVLSALEAYRVTSPQMVVFGRLIREALPG